MIKSLGIPQPDSDVVNKQPKVLLIGYGWVGQYMGKYFTEAHFVDSEGKISKQENPYFRYSGQRYELGIISVPTPMIPETGKCDTSIVEEVVNKYKDIVDIFLVKSTVEIGTCERLEKKYGVPVCMSPEYVGETLGHPLLEPRRDAFQIIGGNKTARELVARMFMKVLHADAPILLVSHKEAEIIKYMENYWIARRVDYWNDVFDVCQAFNASFTNVREGVVLDPRMNRTHSNVYPDNRGWSGKCLPKDMNALSHSMLEKDAPLTTLDHLLLKNALYWRRDYKDKNQLLPKE